MNVLFLQLSNNKLKQFSVCRSQMSGSFLSRTRLSRSCRTRRWSSLPPSARQTRKQSGAGKERRSSRGSNTRLRFLRMRAMSWQSINWPSRSQCTRTWANTQSAAMELRLVHTWMLKVGWSVQYCVLQSISIQDIIWITNICHFLSICDKERIKLDFWFS